MLFGCVTTNFKITTMAKATKKSGPKDKSYVNKSEDYEVSYEKKRKTPAKKFGAGKRGD